MTRRRLFIAALAAVLAVAAFLPIGNMVLAARMMLSLRMLASGSTGQNLAVSMETIRRRQGSRELEALLYRSQRSAPERAVVLVPGISELGCYHPRLMALSRAMADMGFLVLTPDIKMFRQFRMSPQALEEIAFWFERVPELSNRQDAKIGLAGISFSATLALLAASRPPVRDHVAWVLGIGAYDDPMRCSREWFSAGPVTVAPGYYPTRFYARWIIMLAATDMLTDPAERAYLQAVLVDLLLQRRISEAPPGMTPEARRWYRLATMREDQEDPELAREIESYMQPLLYDHITPNNAATDVRCRVFLVHGAHDDLMPPEESLRLCTRIGSRCSLLISPFLTHTHASETPMGAWQKAGAVYDLSRFFLDFAAAAR